MSICGRCMCWMMCWVVGFWFWLSRLVNIFVGFSVRLLVFSSVVVSVSLIFVRIR